MKLINTLIFLLITLTFTNLYAPYCYATDPKVPKLLAISGSTRSESCNSKALKLLAKAATDAGAVVTIVNLKNYPMPLYEADLESQEGLPENAKKLQTLIAAHDGLLIASPEYNGLPTPLLKNTLDWVSRPVKNDPNSGLKVFENKVSALISASPSEQGGLRGLLITAQLLNNLGLLVVPDKVSIGNCFNNFAANGELKDKRLLDLITKEGQKVARMAQALKNSN
jgi:chromate reductase